MQMVDDYPGNRDYHHFHMLRVRRGCSDMHHGGQGLSVAIADNTIHTVSSAEQTTTPPAGENEFFRD
jgi:hypothetical protein